MKKILFLVVFGGLLALAELSQFGDRIYQSLEQCNDGPLLVNFFVIATLCILSFFVFYLSHLIRVPSFVVAIFLGLIAKPLLVPIVTDGEVLGIVVGLGATLILFSGGLEIPFQNFRKLIWKIFSVSFLGLFLTAFLFSWAVKIIGGLIGFDVSILVAVLLGAVLASTDPAAIIPVLKKLRFRNRSVKDLIISESAVTDVAGTLLTIVFLTMALSGIKLENINDWYQAVFSSESMIMLGKQLIFGGLLGVAGYYLLELLLKAKHFFGQEFEADAAFFIAVPIIIFTAALFVEGSGYLAAFMAGLIFHITEHLTETERFFNNLVDGFMKPIIFILLGALVDLPSLIEYAPIGIISALVFMFIIRPIAVFASLGIFHYLGNEKLSFRDLFFISFVRETGAIPAVLMLTILTLGLEKIDGLVEIGMWTILLTLIIEPIFTPMVAKFLNVAELMQDRAVVKISNRTKVILVTRGESFIGRFNLVLDWAILHKVEEVMVLLCLEDKFTKDLEKEIEQKAKKLFEKNKKELSKKGLAEINFIFISREGSLNENIDNLSKADNKISAIFVGKKMLDHRLDEIKQLQVPFYFMD